MVLTLAGTGDVRWRADRSPGSGGSTRAASAVSGADHDQLPGLPVSTTVTSIGAAPARLEVAVAPSTRWDALVVFSD